MIPMIRIMVIVMVTLFSLFFISESSFAQIYKWVDEKGTVNFTDNPDKVPAKYRATVDTLNINPRESPSSTLSVRPEIKSHSGLSKTIQNKPASGRSYYDAHPEERAMDDAIQANKPIRDMQEKLIEDMRTTQRGYGGGSYRDYPLPSSPPLPSFAPSPPSGLIGTRSGAIDSQTGDFYPGVKGGVINPRTGQFISDVGGGYIDPMTGRFIPKQ